MITHGEGCYLFDDTGRRYLDTASGSGAAILGHGDPRIAEILRLQATSLSVYPSRSFRVGIVEGFVERLVAFIGWPDARTALYSSGTEAVEAAIKLVVQYQWAAGRVSKYKVLGRNGSYHGNSLSCLSAGGFWTRRRPFEEVLAHHARAAAAHCVECEYGLTPRGCAVECAASIEKAILEEGPESVAAVILEPVVGAALGAATPDPRYLSQVRAICSKHDVLLISDEVMCGFGRTGLPLAGAHWTFAPDIVCLGKAISAGYFPLSAVVASKSIAEAAAMATPFQNGHTNAFNPVGAAVGLHVIERLSSEDLLPRCLDDGASLRRRLEDTLAGASIVEGVQGIGLMIGLRLTDGTVSGVPSSEAFQQACLRSGLVVHAGAGNSRGASGNHVLLLPPLNLTEAQHGQIVDAVVSAATALGKIRERSKRVEP